MDPRSAQESASTDTTYSLGALATTEPLFRPSALRTMFMRPVYLEPSAWFEHIPFAFWLAEAHQPGVFVELGSHYGCSYFAFCQAVERLGLDTRCFAVDTWEGDEQAGFYGEEVFEKVRTHNDLQYSSFSSLIRSTFDEATQYFSDGTIDLLHIDGFHTYEVVRHDFENWLPKMSERGVVLFHDSNVRERNFGVFKLIEELRSQYPCFEFSHGHGLAVIGVGPKQNEVLRRLFDTSKSEVAQRAIHELFGRLGKACADAFAVKSRQTKYRELETECEKRQQEVNDVRQTLSKVKDDLEVRESALTSLRTEFEDNKKTLSEALEAAASTAQTYRHELDQQAERLAAAEAERERLKITVKDLNRFDEVAKLSQLLKAAEQRAEELQKFAQQTDDRIATMQKDCRVAAARAVGKAITSLIGFQTEKKPTLKQLTAAGQRLIKAKLFDPKWYLDRNADVAAAGIDAAVHYLLHGANEGRAPYDLKLFDTTPKPGESSPSSAKVEVGE